MIGELLVVDEGGYERSMCRGVADVVDVRHDASNDGVEYETTKFSL